MHIFMFPFHILLLPFFLFFFIFFIFSSVNPGVIRNQQQWRVLETRKGKNAEILIISNNRNIYKKKKNWSYKVSAVCWMIWTSELLGMKGSKKTEQCCRGRLFLKGKEKPGKRP